MAKDLEKKKAKREAKAAKRAEKATRRQHHRKAQAVLSRHDIAGQLRALASQVEAGTVVLGDKELELLPGHNEPGSFARALLVNPFLGGGWGFG